MPGTGLLSRPPLVNGWRLIVINLLSIRLMRLIKLPVENPSLNRIWQDNPPTFRRCILPCPSRRAFLTTLGIAAIGPVILSQRAFAHNLPARVDAAALRERIEALSRFGRPSVEPSRTASVGSP